MGLLDWLRLKTPRLEASSGGIVAPVVGKFQRCEKRGHQSDKIRFSVCSMKTNFGRRRGGWAVVDRPRLPRVRGARYIGARPRRDPRPASTDCAYRDRERRVHAEDRRETN
jgi:hypothetical protein